MRNAFKRRSLFAELVFRNLALAFLASVTLATSIALLVKTHNHSQLEEVRARISARLGVEQEKLRTWKSLGMDEALDRELAYLQKKMRLQELSITAVSRAPTDNDDIIVIPKDPSNDSPFVLVAKLSTSETRKVMVPFTAYGLLLLSSVALMLVAVVLTHRFLKREIRHPLERLLAELKSTLPDAERNRRIQSIVSEARAEVRELAIGIEEVVQLRNQVSQNQALAKVVAQVSHDLRSPLSSLRIILALNKVVDLESRDIADKCIQRMSNILEDIVSKYNPNRQTLPNLNIRPSISQLIHEIAEEKSITFNDGRIKILTDFSSSVSENPVPMDSTIFSRIISNLVSNSIEAISQGTGDVQIKVGADSESDLIIEVIDNGCGIPVSILSKVGTHGFSYGKGGDSSGFGLGLSYVCEQVRLAGAFFEIESKEGTGTTVRLRFKNSKQSSNFIKSRPSVIILDDRSEVIEGLRVLLERSTGIPKNNVQGYTSSSDFISDFRYLKNITSAADCFIIDYSLGIESKNGLEIIQSLGISDRSVLFTSHDQEASLETKWRDLDTPVVSKKDFVKLVHIVTSLLGKKNQERQVGVV